MSVLIVAVFVVVYLGMILGGLPLLQLDRTGIALLGAIALVASGAVGLEEAARAVHLPTLILLFSFMVLSAQMRLGGFYTRVTARIAGLPLRPAALAGVLIGVVAALSAVFSNDIVCLACAPVLVHACRERRLDPVPFLLALACAANIGSAATLIGNPQNMLIGQSLALPFGAYLGFAIVPVGVSLGLLWLLIWWQHHRDWQGMEQAPAARELAPPASAPAFDRWQTFKGLAAAGFLLVAFLLGNWPRELLALIAAGIMLTSRKLHSTRMLGLVDWELLILFIGLFVVNHAFAQTGLADQAVARLAEAGVDLRRTAPLFATTFVLSNVVSNVPAVMLLMPLSQDPLHGAMLALVSTFAGNLLIVGSIANIIVVGAAAREGIVIDWRRHARTGVPVTLASLAVCAVFLWVHAGRVAAA